MPMTSKTNDAEYQRQYRARHKAQGLCILCTNKAEPDRTMCKMHLAKNNERSKESRRRREQGLLDELKRLETENEMLRKEKMHEA